jgi:hypothetical protein
MSSVFDTKERNLARMIAANKDAAKIIQEKYKAGEKSRQEESQRDQEEEANRGAGHGGRFYLEKERREWLAYLRRRDDVQLHKSSYDPFPDK